MTRALDSVRKLVLGETWVLPISIAIMLCVLLALRGLAPSVWDQAGGPVTLLGTLGCLFAVVKSSPDGKR